MLFLSQETKIFVFPASPDFRRNPANSVSDARLPVFNTRSFFFLFRCRTLSFPIPAGSGRRQYPHFTIPFRLPQLSKKQKDTALRRAMNITMNIMRKNRILSFCLFLSVSMTYIY